MLKIDEKLFSSCGVGALVLPSAGWHWWRGSRACCLLLLENGMEEVPAANASLFGSYSDSFECSICSEDMTTRECVVTNCDHCFCRACLEDWERSQLAKGQAVQCPQCRKLLSTYEQLKWPLFIRSFREELVTKLRKFEREKATLVGEKQRVEEQLTKDRAQQQALQRTVDDLRNLTVKKNESDIQKLRRQIAEMEQTVGHADKAAREEKQRELLEAREVMAGLENQSRALAAELEKKQRDVEALQREMAAGAALLEEKHQELTRLQAANGANAAAAAAAASAVATSAAAAAAASSAAAAADARDQNASSSVTDLAETLVSYAQGSSYYLAKGWKFASKLFTNRSAHLLRPASDFEMLERRGCHLGCAVWRAIDKKCPSDGEGGSESAVCAIKWKRGDGSPQDSYREAMILSALSHEHIVPVLGVIAGKDDQIGLVMPFCETDLEYVLAPDNVDGLRLDAGAQARIAVGLLSALAYAHAQQVVHRSISSSVVLLNGRRSQAGHAVLAGWTEAASLSSPVRSTLVRRGAGSRYLSPEFVLSASDSGQNFNWKAFDMWAAGCVIWEVLLENSLTPLVPCDSSDLAEQVRALCSWQELRAEAAAWLSTQEKGRFPVLEKELSVENAAARSMVAVLQDKMVAPEAIALVCKLLTWDPARRITAYNALLDGYLANTPKPPPGREIADQKGLSNAALDEWIASME